MQSSRPFSPLVLNPPVDRNLAYQRAEGHGNADDLLPENIRKRATADDPPPTILHKIVSILHRSLKSKEDAIWDIENEYKENASRLLRSMNTRHGAEKLETEKAHRKASHVILETFTEAGEAFTGFINDLRAIHVRNTLVAVKRTSLLEKLGLLRRLCETTSQQGSNIYEEESESEEEELIEEFQTKLLEMAKLPDEMEDPFGAPEDDTLQEICAEAEKLLNEPSKLAHESEHHGNTLYDFMEGAVDSLIRFKTQLA
ncbi:hypothetical protein B0H67DRAFT_548795 [Lasiosphaeris hirsuta]|uniref:Uncharacterized protein n=1 Tax=Lasiosphaeris hirsuta TaxID=260670 RepID=A0AA40BB05_9PEZI|nr:hypothetical protein B0H67DRAFT_548795 [Lasiosphaeris hirsuta]